MGGWAGSGREGSPGCILLGNAWRIRRQRGGPGSGSRCRGVCPGRCCPRTSGGAAARPLRRQAALSGTRPPRRPALSPSRKSPQPLRRNFRSGTRGRAGLLAGRTLCFRGAGDAGRATSSCSDAADVCGESPLPAAPCLPFEALVVAGAMNKKKKPFLGMPAPLGYVPGLGRG